MKRNLTEKSIAKYKLVVDEYFVNGFNGSKAYFKFHPNIKKNSTAAANWYNASLLPEVKAYINEKQAEAAKKINTTHEGILKELKAWVEADITETISLTPEDIKLLPVGLRRLITKYKQTNREFYNSEGSVVSSVETIELQFISKEKAIDMINKHVGFYEKDNEQKASPINIHTTNDKHKSIVQDIIDGKK